MEGPEIARVVRGAVPHRAPRGPLQHAFHGSIEVVDRKPIVKKLVKKKNAYFTVSWSRLKKSDKYDIIKSVPSEAGIYELYYMDEKEKLCLFYLGKSWYGGLRNELREKPTWSLRRTRRGARSWTSATAGTAGR